MIDTEKMRENFGADFTRSSSHYEGCEYVHPLCAIEALCREVERLRKEVQDRMWGTGELGCYKKHVRPLLPTAEEVDALNTALGGWQSNEEGHRHAKELRRNMNAVLPPKPDWLPAPDTMPDDLAPAQMVELHGWEGNRVPARKVAWEIVSKYRLLYSDSGEVICSADGLEEWAQFVATDGDGQVWQYECVPEEDDGLWEQVMGSANPAPSTHRKPGPWIESLMEVTRR